MTATLIAIWLAALASPGPDLLLVLKTGWSAGRRAALAAACGIVSGIALWVAAALAGLAALLAVYPAVDIGLRIAGGLVLLWIGVGGLRAWWRGRGSGKAGASSSPTASEVPARDSRGWFTAGLLTNATNPKALVFFGAILAPLLPADVTVGWAAGTFAMMTAIALAWFCALAVAATLGPVRRAVLRAWSVLEAGISAIFAALGLGMLGSVVAAVAR